MPREIVPLQRAWIPELGEFLRRGFGAPAEAQFARPDVLEWQYFDDATEPRSFVARDNGQIAGHVGLCPTSFVVGRQNVSTVHMISWLASAASGPVGAMLMLRAFQSAETQYALGCSPDADRVMRGAGYRVMQTAPLFQRVLHPRAWQRLHRRQPAWKRAALVAADWSRQALRGLPEPGARLELRRVREFDAAVEPIVEAAARHMAFTSRAPALLNHYLRYPTRSMSGWLLAQGGRARGFAVLNVHDKDGVRLGKIVDLLLEEPSEDLWRAGIAALSGELVAQGAELAWCYATTPWLMAALTSSGYFRRGSAKFYLRDPKRLLPDFGTIHLSLLEGDLAYL
jgi:hypothetical protein